MLDNHLANRLVVNTAKVPNFLNRLYRKTVKLITQDIFIHLIFY